MEDGKRDSSAIENQRPGALRIYDGAIGDDFCDELIQAFEDNVEELGEILKDEHRDFVEYNYTQHNTESDVHANLMSHFAELFKHYLKDNGVGLMMNLAGFEQLKIRKYDKDTEQNFKIHTDVVDHDSALRAVGFLFYLNDVEGNTDFPLQNMGVEPKKGRVVIFPPGWDYPYIDYTGKDNDKYVMSTYLHYA